MKNNLEDSYTKENSWGNFRKLGRMDELFIIYYIFYCNNL